MKNNLDIIYRTFFFFVLVIFLSSCGNEDLNYMSGELTDMSTGEPVSDAKVKFDIIEISGGNFNTSFEPFLETFTDNEGRFLFEFENRNFVKMRLSYSKDGYHEVSTIFEPENLSEEYVVNNNIPKESYISIRVFNSFPYLPDDVLKLRILNVNEECDVCCSSEYRYFNGAYVDTTFLCKVVGGDNVTINYISIHDDVSNVVENQVYCTPSDTVVYNCFY